MSKTRDETFTEFVSTRLKFTACLLRDVKESERFTNVSNKCASSMIANLGHFGHLNAEAAIPIMEDIRDSVLLDMDKERLLQTIEALTMTDCGFAHEPTSPVAPPVDDKNLQVCNSFHLDLATDDWDRILKPTSAGNDKIGVCRVLSQAAGRIMYLWVPEKMYPKLLPSEFGQQRFRWAIGLIWSASSKA